MSSQRGEFSSLYNIGDNVEFGSAKNRQTGKIVAVRFTEVAVFYDIFIAPNAKIKANVEESTVDAA